jgi:hypothetical protein
LIGGILTRYFENANNLLDILEKLVIYIAAGKLVKYWKALGRVIKERKN